MRLFWVSICFVTIVIVSFLIWGKSLETELLLTLENWKRWPVRYVLGSFLLLTSDIVLPIPSSIVMFINGTVLGFWFGFGLSFLSVMASSILGYFLGKALSKPKVDKTATQAVLALNKYGGFAIILSRGIPVLSETICVICGFSQMNFRKYVLFNIYGFVPVCMVYNYFGSIALNNGLFLFSLGASIIVTLFFATVSHYLLPQNHSLPNS